MTYFDPEQVDASEQEFAVSLEKTSEEPDFVIEPDAPAVQQETGPNAAPMTRDVLPLGNLSEAPAENFARAGAEAAAGEGAESRDSDSASDWRNLVSEKVNKYRSRRPRKERYPSLQLEFEEPREFLRQESRRSHLEVAERELATAPVIEATSTAREMQPVLIETTARVLEFPRPVAALMRTEELAEPILERPRIIEAPELVPPPPAMGGILMDPGPEPEPERRPGFEIPLQSASLGRRIAAGLTDAAMVSGAVAGFAYIAWRITGATLLWRTEAISLIALFVLLWSAYQFAFLVFSGNTLGLLLARLKMQKFDGAAVSRDLRRWRALASILSLTSLGLGYAWCFLDEDQLSWHDRITHTHLAPRKKP